MKQPSPSQNMCKRNRRHGGGVVVVVVSAEANGVVIL
jgi:hypothetical protein